MYFESLTVIIHQSLKFCFLCSQQLYFILNSYHYRQQFLSNLSLMGTDD